mgnify:CR=1 FL=1
MRVRSFHLADYSSVTQILEEVLNFSGNKIITSNLVNEKYNTLGVGESVTQMLIALSQKDMKKGFHICRELVNQGTDFKYFIEVLVDRLHQILLGKVGLEKEDEEISLSVSEIRKLYELLTEAYNDTKFSVLPQAPLELAIMEWSEENIEKEPEVANNEPKEEVLEEKAKVTNPKTTDFFTNLIDEVKIHNNLLAGVLRGCSANEIKNGNLCANKCTLNTKHNEFEYSNYSWRREINEQQPK